MSAAILTLVATMSWAAPPAKSDVLPLRKLRLYETGVGYFERRGAIGKGTGASLPLPASHLDDALKTLVVLDSSGSARVTGLQFASAVTESGARAIAGLPQTESELVGYVDVLLSLKGSEVEVRRGTQRTRGTLIEVEGPFHAARSKDDPKNPMAEPWYAIVLVGDDGGVFRVRTDEVESVRALQDAARGRLKVAAQALSDQRARRTSALEVRVSSTGNIGLGYIAEAPVWRTTYRVVLPPDAGPGELQAWALVHNDTDEDWRKVMLELANGQPQSFLYPLAAPRYAYRGLAKPPEELSTVPQLANNSADRMWDSEMGYGVGGLGLVGAGRGGGGTGMGTIGFGSVGTIGHGSGSAEAGAGPRLGDLATLSQAEGEESGALFVYKIRDALDLKAHHSALVPIVQSEVEVESIAWFTGDDTTALSGARVVNTTHQTLPSGVVAFFEHGGFVGESALHRLKPKERQFVVFGSEQDVELDQETVHKSTKVVGLKRGGAQLHVQLVHTNDRILQINNRSGRPRNVYVTLRVDRNAVVTPPPGVTLDYDGEAASALAIIEVPAGSEVTKVLAVTTGSAQTRENDDATLRWLAKETSLPKPQRAALNTLLGHRAEHARAQAEFKRQRKSFVRGDLKLVRMRKDLEALAKVRPSGAVAKKIARKMLDTEREVDDARDRAASARDSMRAAKRAEDAAWENIPTLHGSTSQVGP